MNTQQANKEAFTVREVMLETGIKARATLDKYIAQGVIKPIKKRGKQPETYRGRKFYFKGEAIAKLKKYMQTHGRIQPKGMEIKQKVKETRVSRKMKVQAAQMPQAQSGPTKAELAAQLSTTIQQVEHLVKVVKMLSESVREMSTTH